jgi:hypothetical protein
MSKPILCLDFDGVIHSYASGWKGADVIPDPPVDGAFAFICDAFREFKISIFSSRSNQPGGLAAMQEWLRRHFLDWASMAKDLHPILDEIEWPTEKPSAFVTIDDRAIQFDGSWPSIESLRSFKPWNKRELGATGTFSHGKISDDDEGDLKIGVASDLVNGIVRINFGKRVAWLGMEPENAVAFAELILKHARRT